MSLSTSMSMSLKSTQNVAGDSPSWDEICQALSVLAIELSLEEGTASHRLSYEEFERIIYQLFILIDGPGTRRKFRLIYPAGDRERREQFIDLTITFVNQRKLTQQPLTKSHLRAFGGERIRRVLCEIIEQALKNESAKIKKYISTFQSESDLVNNELGNVKDLGASFTSKIEGYMRAIADRIEQTQKVLDETDGL